MAGCVVVHRLAQRSLSEAAERRSRPGELPDQREFHSLTQSHRDGKREGTLAADGVIAMVTIDAATRKSRPLPDELAAAGRP